MRYIYIFLFVSIFCFKSFSQQPSLKWANNAGSSGGSETGYNITTDAAGNTYVTGSFTNMVDFDPGAPVFNLTSNGGDDIYMKKLDANGGFLWAVSVGGTGNDVGRSITFDGAGNIYFTGYYSNTVDFDPGTGVFNLTSSGGYDIFILKLDANGNFIWAKSVGGTGTDQCISITSDAAGNVYTAGHFQNTADFDPGAGVFNLVSNGSNDIFNLKLDNNGNLIWANSIGGAGIDQVGLITTDNAGSFYITGIFQNTFDFDPGVGVTNLTAIGGLDAYIKKFDANGNFIWAKSIGGASGVTFGVAIKTDGAGNVYTSGYFQGTVDFDPGAGTVNLSSQGGDDLFVQKLDASGSFVWANSSGSTGNDRGFTIFIDGSNNIYTGGTYENTVDFDPGVGVSNLTSVGGEDAFVQKLDVNGNFVWASNIGGTGNEVLTYISIDAASNIYTTGSFENTVDFDPEATTFNLSSNGLADAFTSKWSQCSPVLGTDVRTVCDSLLWINGITYYTNNNTAVDTLFSAAANGCDSIVTLNLTVNSTPVATPISNITVCEGDSVNIPTFTSLPTGSSFNWTNDNASIGLGLTGIGSISSFISAASGIANIEVTPTLNGCTGDSVVFSVTVNSTYSTPQSVSICVGDSILLGGAFQTTPGLYYDTLQSVNTCDSLIISTLAVNDSTSNYIEGVVFFQGTPISAGEVRLIRKDGNTPQTIFNIDTVSVNVSGGYSFSGLRPADYILKALGDTTMYKNVATYADSTNYWQNANLKTINFGCEDSLFNVDIHLIDIPTLSGIGKINGNIQENGNPNLKAPGDPVPGIDITVEQSPGGVVSGAAISDGNGDFGFTLIPAGNYYLNADIPGYVCDTTNIISFDGTGRSYDITICVFDTLNIIDECKRVFTLVEETEENSEFNIYPVPAKDHVIIESSSNEPYLISILDASGREVFQTKEENNTTRVNMNNYPNGLYQIRISWKDKVKTSKLIIVR